MGTIAKAMVLEALNQPMVLQDVQVADPIGREVLVEVRASGICHSDMMAATAESPFPLPMILGHEVSGVVVAVGPAVNTLAVGDHVVACEVESCGHCEDCLRGKMYRCRHPHDILRGEGDAPRITSGGRPVTQFSNIGGFMNYVLLHENALVKIPAEMPFDRAAIMGCGVVTGFGAIVNTAQLRVGDTAAVIGCGGVGLNAIRAARLCGCRRIIALDIKDSALDMAKRFGATDLVNSLQEDPVAAVMRITGGVGADCAFEIAGSLQTTKQAMDMTRPTGIVYLIGIQKPTNVLELSPFWDLLLAKKSLVSVFMGSTNFKYDIPLIVDLYLQGRYNLDDLVARTCSLEDVEKGFQALRNGEVARTVITF